MAMMPSIKRMTGASSRRTYPAARPMARPATIAMALTSAASVIDKRPPYSTRDSRSRPSESVPSQYSSEEPCKRARGVSVAGS
ncbi:hypothetical protein D3C77_672360 [compost metagenome]